LLERSDVDATKRYAKANMVESMRSFPRRDLGRRTTDIVVAVVQFRHVRGVVQSGAETVTFLFSDLEGSTRLWDRYPDAMPDALATHDMVVRRAVQAASGHIFKMTGDGVLAVFTNAADAAAAAVALQRELAAAKWGRTGPLRTRVGIHSAVVGDIEAGCHRAGDDWFGPALNRCQRIMSTAHGGQVVLSGSAAESAASRLQGGMELRDLGVRQLRDLWRPEHLHQLVSPVLESDFPPLRSLDAFPGNLPPQMSSFVGREDELKKIAELISQSRLVTLTGVGGVGKTRLVIQSAAELVPQFTDGAWLAEFAPISDPALVPGRVAATLGLRERAGQSVTDMIADYLADRSLLLVLDNCEHLIDSTGRLVDTLLNAAPYLHVLAASREALGLSYERGYRVPVLGVPAPSDNADTGRVAGSAAVQLFVERARAVTASFEVTAENQADVAELCRRLDGIPLALELAAVRIDAMTPAEIVQHLEHRFQLLRAGREDAGRHQTLRGTIDWSHQLLEPQAQTLFSRLSVFAGGWTITSGRAVTAGNGLDEPTVVDGIASLVRKSMVVAEGMAKTTRYRMLESLRQYAHDRLTSSSEEAAIRSRHADHFTRLVEELADDLRGPRQDAAYAALLTELDNVRAAFDWHLTVGDAATALRLVRLLRTFWTELMPSEGVQRALAAVAIGDTATAAARAGGLADAAWIGYVGGRDECVRYAEESVAVSEAAGVPPDPEALFTIALRDLFAGDFERSLAGWEESIIASRAIDDPYELACALTGTCLARAFLGDLAAAIAVGEEAVEIARDLGYLTQIAGSLAALGFAYGARDPERGVVLLDESLATKSDTTYSALARVVSGHLHVVLGDYDGALRLFGKTLEIYGELGDAFYLPTSLEGIAAALCLRGRAAVAARLLGASEEMRRKLVLPGLPIEVALRKSALDMVAASLAEDAQEHAFIIGRRWSVDETVTYALAEIASSDSAAAAD
jgi:predicted ATPase/class 3 adenylate cyclase